MSNETDRKRPDEEQARHDVERQMEQMEQSLRRFDKDAQTAAVLALDMALSGSPQMTRPTWLEGMSQEAMLGVRQMLSVALANVTVDKQPKATTNGKSNTDKQN